jgi:hypothetical protein
MPGECNRARRSPPPGLRLPHAKLSRNSNQIARGQIRRFESDMPSQAVSLRDTKCEVRSKPRGRASLHPRSSDVLVHRCAGRLSTCGGKSNQVRLAPEYKRRVSSSVIAPGLPTGAKLSAVQSTAILRMPMPRNPPKSRSESLQGCGQRPCRRRSRRSLRPAIGRTSARAWRV